MKTLNKICIFFAMSTLVVIAGLGMANAQQVTVTYQVFPSGAVLDTNVITSCDNATADSFPGYTFLFWDNQGANINWSPTVTICPGLTNTVATAWYQAKGGGGTCPPGCALTTFAFSIDNNVVLNNGTAISYVTPNSPVVWTSPSTSVDTDYSAESISALSALAFPPYAAEPFRYWQQLQTQTQTPIGVVYQASQDSTAWVVAFYGPDPCQIYREELQSCLYGDGQHGKLNCSLYSKELQLCEQQNREQQ